jgi:hypothetical protein
MPFPEVVDSTILGLYKSCPRKFWLEQGLHWKPKSPSVHLHAGAAFARGLEVARNAYWAGVAEVPVRETIRDPDTGAETVRIRWDARPCTPGNAEASETLGHIALLTAYGDFQCPEDSAKSATRMAGALEFYFDRYPLGADGAEPVTLASGKRGIEISFAEPLDLVHPVTGNPLLYCGRLDQAVHYAGGVFGEDDKTTSSLGATWSKQWDLRSQFTGYCWGLGRIGLPLNGFLVRGVSILKTKYDTLEALTYRHPWQIDEWYDMTLATLADMIRDWKSGYWRKVLDHACTDFGGCVFRQVCLSSVPDNWLSTYFERRRWDPLTRTETVL